MFGTMASIENAEMASIPPIPLLMIKNALNFTDFSAVIIKDSSATNIMVSSASEI